MREKIQINERITWVVADPTDKSIIPVNMEVKIAEWILKTHLPEIPKLPKWEPKPEPVKSRWYEEEKPRFEIPWDQSGSFSLW